MSQSSLPIAAKFFGEPTETGGSLEGNDSSTHSSFQVTYEFTGLMIRGGRSRDWNYCIAVAHDLKHKTTRAVILGLESHEHLRLKLCLKESLELTRHPTLLPIILVELKIHFFAILLEKRAKGLDEIEYETGMRHGFSNNPIRNPPRESRQKSRENLDFDLLTQKLTGLAGTFAFSDLTFQAGLESLGVVKQVAQRCSVGAELEPPSASPVMPPDLDRRVEYLEGLIAGSQHTRRLLQQRTQAQVQTVSGSFMQNTVLLW